MMFDTDDCFTKVYDAINENEELPNIEYPDADAAKSIIEFHACKFGGQSDVVYVHGVP